MIEKKYLKLNDIEAYKISFNLSNLVWDKVIKWNSFEQKTIGQQFVNSVDSISANIAEGFGRYSKKDKTRFYRISFGSMYEALDWNEKAFRRKLLKQIEHETILTELKKLPQSLHHLVNFTEIRLKK